MTFSMARSASFRTGSAICWPRHVIVCHVADSWRAMFGSLAARAITDSADVGCDDRLILFWRSLNATKTKLRNTHHRPHQQRTATTNSNDEQQRRTATTNNNNEQQQRTGSSLFIALITLTTTTTTFHLGTASHVQG